MNTLVFVVVCCWFAAALAFPIPPSSAVLPGYELLPADVQEKLKTLFEDKSLSWEQRRDRMFEIMDNLPDELKSKLPPPKCFELLPKDVRDKLREIQMDNTLTWKVKLQKIREFIDHLPDDIKRLLPRTPLPQGFELLPGDFKERIKLVHEDRTLTPGERLAKFREIFESLPADVKALLP